MSTPSTAPRLQLLSGVVLASGGVGYLVTEGGALPGWLMLLGGLGTSMSALLNRKQSSTRVEDKVGGPPRRDDH